MKPIYLYDIGVKPWEQAEPVADQKYSTITIVQRSVDDLFSLWVKIAIALMATLPNVIKWHSVGYSLKGSKVQEIKLLKQLKRELTDGYLLEKSENTGIYSYVKNVSQLVSTFDLNTITHSRYTMLLFTAGGLSDLKNIWNLCQDADGGITSDVLATMLEEQKGIIVCRVTESDTHAAAQFIGEMSMVDIVLELVTELKIERVLEQEVFCFINE